MLQPVAIATGVGALNGAHGLQESSGKAVFLDAKNWVIVQDTVVKCRILVLGYLVLLLYLNANVTN